uniref:Kinesin motor domain-containing protein n=1 Tax=Moschus moschiferus TaxID=68415 RepID=A0A8C6D5X6_MOSMO
MSQGILSLPAGLLSDAEVIVSPMFESTAADLGSVICKDLLSDCYLISTSLEDKQVPSEDGTEKVKVYLRVRPLLPSELERQEDQGCVYIENMETLALQAPKDSFAQKSNEQGIGQATHRFTFPQIFGPEVGQASFFNLTVKEMVNDVLKGQNCLIYTYGVTNSGKTYTIQGTIKDGGILPRSLALIFNSLQGQLHPTPNLKSLFSSEVMWLDSKQIQQEELKKLALLNGGLQEEELSTSLKKSVYIDSRMGTSTSFDSGIAGLSSSSQFPSSSQLGEMSHRWAQPDTAPITCCHNTGAGKLRHALATCDDILIKQDQTLAELQNNMTLVKLDLRKKAARISEQYHIMLKLQGQASTKKRLGTNQENQQPNQQPPGKKPFLRNLLPRTPTCPSSTDCSPYARILRSRRSPLLKSGPFGKKY